MNTPFGGESLELRRDQTFVYSERSDEGGSGYEVAGTWAKTGRWTIITNVNSDAPENSGGFPHGQTWRVTMGGLESEARRWPLRRRGN
jgi:hypothetical protein